MVNEEDMPSEDGATVEQTVQQLQLDLETAQAALADANDKLLRSRAEVENMRRRAALDVESAHKYSIDKIANELVHVVDSLEKGLEAANNAESTSEQNASLIKGMELTHKLLISILEKFKIHQIDPLGEVFDPKQHEALTTQATDEMEPDRVLAVVQKGFLIHDRVLRPARVIVSK